MIVFMANNPMETERLIITRFDLSFVGSAQRLSVEQSNRAFLPDEVFETVEDAQRAIEALIAAYDGVEGPFVYPVVRRTDGAHMGHVEAAQIGPGRWEVGYHIGEAYQGHGYATEAVRAFMPFILEKLGVDRLYGVCRADNAASCRVLERSGYLLAEEAIGPYLGQETLVRRYIYQG